jgi:glycosyltransferase involved in cell wall biosynthesis
VRFLGHRSDIAEINACVDVAVVPSIAFEGIPYTIREAMRAAKPVITTDAGGCDEAIVDQISGILVEQKNHLALANAILQLLGNPEKRKCMGEQSRKLFFERFFLPNKVEEHTALYQKLMQKVHPESTRPMAVKKVA